MGSIKELQEVYDTPMGVMGIEFWGQNMVTLRDHRGLILESREVYIDKAHEICVQNICSH